MGNRYQLETKTHPTHGECSDLVDTKTDKALVIRIKSRGIAKQILKGANQDIGFTLNKVLKQASFPNVGELTRHGHSVLATTKWGATPQPINCRTSLGTPAKPDPKTEQFINIANELGYDIHDLHEMDNRLKNWIADLVDMSEELDNTGDIKGMAEDGSSPRAVIAGRTSATSPTPTAKPRKQGASPTFGQSYGNPVIPSAKPELEEVQEPEEETLELDNWDCMAGRHRSSRDLTTTKKPYEPDTIDPSVDPMEEIRRMGGRAGH